ncbi:MAG: hypothetical protein IPK17_02020 [Chloroflexi bacterium]|uniref:hypothetical protein n=1 Tax=Candidatus Flexifilum breve TaxID=3140694 RepID=UPI0031357D40|nr:hypothetical protein [Chloroflexota bacterium]
MFRRLIPLLLFLLITPFTLTAQDAHPPQFLYRDGDQLVLVSITGDTSEAVPLPTISVGGNDQIRWSPDGRSLLTLTASDGRLFSYCLNVYDVERLRWMYEAPIACHVREAQFAHDSSTIAFSVDMGENEQLWLYKLADDTAVMVTETTNGITGFEAYVVRLRWSPTDKYLLWEQIKDMMGGGSSTLYVRDLTNNFTYTIIAGFDGYYASYNPIWSPDEEWFLLGLREEYIRTNHKGDVYLVHAIDGTLHRITYTPAEEEWNLRWTDDGHIGFDVVHSRYLSLEDALGIPETEIDAALEPAPYDPRVLAVLSRFPDRVSKLDGWIVSTGESIDNPARLILYIGDFTANWEQLFSAELPRDYRTDTGIIGWRPTGDGDS